MKHREADQNIIGKLQTHISFLEGKVLQNEKVAPATQAPEFKNMESKLAEALGKVQELEKDNAKRAKKQREMEEALKEQESHKKKSRGRRRDADDSDYSSDDDDMQDEDPSRTFLTTADGTQVFWLYIDFPYLPILIR